MATVKQVFGPRDALFPATAPARFKAVAGSNFPVESLAFSATVTESAFFTFPALAYGSGNITVRINWYADTATAEDVVFGCSLAAITPNSDTQDIETDAFATETTGTDAHLGTTGQRLHEMTVTVSNLDSVAAGDWCVLKVRRIHDDAADDMSGDALVVLVTVEYSDA